MNSSAPLHDHAAHQVTLWHAASSRGDPGRLEQKCCDWLAEDELRAADRFRVPTGRNQHIVGRGMARRLLGAGLTDPTAIKFGFEGHGKPFVQAPDEVKRPFNVAHTNGLVLCGIGTQRIECIGVDVECFDRRTRPDLAERYFSKPEIEFLRRQKSDVHRREAFLRIWTLKESFIKAIGTGLQTPLADFAFRAIESETPTIEMLDPRLEDGLSWQFYSLRPRAGFVAAVAVGLSEPADIGLKVKSFEEDEAESEPT